MVESMIQVNEVFFRYLFVRLHQRVKERLRQMPVAGLAVGRYFACFALIVRVI